MKKVFSVWMLLLILLISFQQAVIIVLFKLNQATIEQAFCINKNKPELQCHGKCHLKGKLQDAENSRSDVNSLFKNIDMLPISVVKTGAEILLPVYIGNKSMYKETEYSDPYMEVLLPPPKA